MTGSTVGLFIPASLQTHEYHVSLLHYDGYNVTRLYFCSFPSHIAHSDSSADSCSGWLHLSSSLSISGLSMHNSRFSILLSICDILIHCPHFLCHSFIFNSISDLKISFISLLQFSHLILFLFVSIIVGIAFLPNYIKRSSGLE